MNLLVSACLLGQPCRYDGSSKPHEAVMGLREQFCCIPVCPEVLGGLSTPREPSEICGACVLSRTGQNVSAAYHAGAEAALALAKAHHCRYAVLKERSPSCGHDLIYDGSFTKTLKAGHGITAALLMKNDIRVFGESELPQLFAALQLEH